MALIYLRVETTSRLGPARSLVSILSAENLIVRLVTVSLTRAARSSRKIVILSVSLALVLKIVIGLGLGLMSLALDILSVLGLKGKSLLTTLLLAL